MRAKELAATDHSAQGPGATPSPAMTTRKPARRAAAGILFVAASALAFGALPIFARVAYASGVDASTLLLLRFSVAAAVMWAVVAMRRSRLPRGRGLVALVAMGALGYAGQAFCYFTALTLASAGLTALLLYLYPALVAILSRVVFRQPLSTAQAGAVALALAGTALTIGPLGEGRPLGILLALLAALIYAVYIMTGSRLPPDVGSAASTAIITSSAAVVYGAIAVVHGVRLPSAPAGWFAVVAIALLGTVLAIAFFLAGLSRLGPVRASTYSTLEPVFTVALAALLLGERVTLLRALGGALILAAVLVLARARAGAPAARTSPEEA
jgi:drug/metabolite transporter (DMT)-like permease